MPTDVERGKIQPEILTPKLNIDTISISCIFATLPNTLGNRYFPETESLNLLKSSLVKLHLYLSGRHGRLRLHREGESLPCKVDDDVLRLLQLQMIAGVEDDPVGQGERLGRALARF